MFDVESYCFRREPSADVTRMQTFRMREYVRAGSASQVLSFRDQWLQRAEAFVAALGLTGEIAAANDPFFGSRGEALSAIQLAKGLKYEMLVAIKSADEPTACMSFNFHETHFAGIWNIRLADGTLAHTACVGFGMERLALALFATHGVDVDRWPCDVRQALWGA